MGGFGDNSVTCVIYFKNNSVYHQRKQHIHTKVVTSDIEDENLELKNKETDPKQSKDAKKANENKKKPICRDFKANKKCKFGAKNCQFEQPMKCQKILQFGLRKFYEKGCEHEKDCDHFHPRINEESDL